MKPSIIILLLLFAAPVMAVDAYLCIPDHSAGLKYNKVNKKYETATFTTNEKYIVKKSKRKSTPWIVTEVGNKFPSYRCDPRNHKEQVLIICNGLFQEFKLHEKNMRFQVTGNMGYLFVGETFFKKKTQDGDNDLHITIGKCSPL